MKDLLEFMDQIMMERDRNRLNLTNSPNPIVADLHRYQRIYKITEPSDHTDYFHNVYDQHRSDIIRGHVMDDWLKNGKIKIQFGEGIQQVRKDRVIRLSAIYINACQLRDETDEQLKGLPNEDQERERRKELNYPDIFMLHLYRIFRAVVPEDQEVLTQRITAIEQDLGLQAETPSVEGNGLNGIMSTMTQFISNLGLKPPQGTQLPTENDFGKIFNSMFNNPNTQNAIGNVFKDLQNCKNVNEVFQKLISGFTDPTLAQTLTETIGPNSPAQPPAQTPTNIGEID